MTVTLTVSKTLTGSGVADTLAGGGSGLDLGQVINGQFTPIVDQSTNNGAQDVYMSHNATIDPITGVKTYVQAYGSGTGYTYGGADTAANDLTTLLNYGNASSSVDANNSDGLAGGLQIDMDWQVSQANQFLHSRLGTNLRIYGASGGVSGDGSGLSTGIDMHVDAMSHNNTGTEVDATTPVTGKIGKSGDTVLGDRAHLKMRFYLPTSATNGGLLQWEYVTAFSYTA